ncbi:hypothetical protein FEM48_Zijuj08G0158200 [Ziziphus jujuba var. spinosa]|uniref:Uncharacterized protein n=1 Tax=Ziziphus jujuba var. spinosa TaxID=714518 RepID=A0A978V000_ZIZJJ|nr:hypothetical protein FEM48_Zijuj08G0158200 [Ziziphus jujuba var. spinosa]
MGRSWLSIESVDVSVNCKGGSYFTVIPLPGSKLDSWTYISSERPFSLNTPEKTVETSKVDPSMVCGLSIALRRLSSARINEIVSFKDVLNFLARLDSSDELGLVKMKVTIVKEESMEEGCKGLLLYMVLHARVVLDLCEHLEQEIVLNRLKSEVAHSSGADDEKIYIEQETASSDIDECDDDYGTPAEQVPDTNGKGSFRQRPRVPGLQRDIEILKAELLKFIEEHGQEGFMPMRKQLRLHGRVDIEKAITRMGGFRRIASLMNLSLAYKHRKPKGFWDSLEICRKSRFQRSWGMDPTFMPSRKSFERAGRYDIARALEKWGGLHEVSRLLSLKLRRQNRQAYLSREKKIDYLAPSHHDLDDKSEEVILVRHDGAEAEVEVTRLGVIEDKEVGVLHSLHYQNHVVQV